MRPADPYRIFFPLGVVFGLAGVAIWPLYYFGMTATYSGRAHALVQTSGFLYAFVAGFLLTAVPRFTGTTAPSRATQYALAGLLIVTVAAAETRAFTIATTAFAAAHLTLLVLVARRFIRRQQDPPATFVLIGLGLLAGLAGAAIACGVAWEAAPPSWDLVGKRLQTEGMMLLLVLGVGGFLGPRLLGFAAMPAPPLRPGAPALAASGRSPVWFAAGILILCSLVAEYAFDVRWMAMLRAAIVTAVMLWTVRLWQRPAVRTTLSWCVWTAEWLVVISVWHVALAPKYRVDLLHMLFIGGFTLLIFAVGTRVTLSHGGHDLAAERRSWPLRIGLTMGSIAMLARLGAPFTQSTYFDHLAFAALLWMAGVLFWGLYIVRLIRLR